MPKEKKEKKEKEKKKKKEKQNKKHTGDDELDTEKNAHQTCKKHKTDRNDTCDAVAPTDEHIAERRAKADNT